MSQIRVVKPVTRKAAYHVRIQHVDGSPKLAKMKDLRGFGQEALVKVQELARKNSPQGCRVLMHVGEFGRQLPGQPIAFDLLGGEILRTAERSMYDPKKEIRPSDVDKIPNENCVFDKIIKGEIPVKSILNDGEVFVFPPKDKLAKKHLLFIPCTHYRDIFGVTDPNFFGSVFTRIVEIAGKEEFNGGFMLESNSGPWAGQAVPHLHIHMRGGEQLRSPYWQDWEV